ncbi:dolichyl-P-Man:Man(7)GlcNAc(2)-PP-dolichol alpha-1,6-mannosyltransferase, partial [Ascoidea rubescens DSM 1968]
MKWIIHDTFFLLFISFALIISPYSKVEESFNTQAIYDLLNFNTNRFNFDHFQFPGVVPRTFIGSILISLLSKPFQNLLLNHPLSSSTTQLDLQLFSRLILGLLNSLSIFQIRNSLSRKSHQLANWYCLLQFTQFHLPYYSTRFLPNFIALPFVNYSISLIIDKKYSLALFLLSFIGIIFRVEIVAFAASLSFVLVFVYPFISLRNALIYHLSGFIASVLLSSIIDSYFWNVIPMIPELISLIFNVLEGNSKLWGVEPFLAYFYKYLPKIFFPPTVLILSILGLYKNQNMIRILGLSSFLFILIMSTQGHKEWRFIIYTIPCLTIAAANGINNYSKFNGIKYLTIIGILLSFSFSLINIYISSLNYPGGHALQELNQFILNKYNHNHIVHMDVYPCMTGITKFGYLRQDKFPKGVNLTYDKTENFTKLNEIWPTFDYYITNINIDSNFLAKNAKNININNTTNINFENWKLIKSIEAFNGINTNQIKKTLFEE